MLQIIKETLQKIDKEVPDHFIINKKHFAKSINTNRFGVLNNFYAFVFVYPLDSGKNKITILFSDGYSYQKNIYDINITNITTGNLLSSKRMTNEEIEKFNKNFREWKAGYDAFKAVKYQEENKGKEIFNSINKKVEYAIKIFQEKQYELREKYNLEMPLAFWIKENEEKQNIPIECLNKLCLLGNEYFIILVPKSNYIKGETPSILYKFYKSFSRYYDNSRLYKLYPIVGQNPQASSSCIYYYPPNSTTIDLTHEEKVNFEKLLCDWISRFEKYNWDEYIKKNVPISLETIVVEQGIEEEIIKNVEEKLQENNDQLEESFSATSNNQSFITFGWNDSSFEKSFLALR